MRKRTAKPYLVGIPIPSLDRRGRPLPPDLIAQWMKRAMDELTGYFGGATPVPAPGSNVVQGPDGAPLMLYEQGQTLVLAGCDSREAFLEKRNNIEAFAEAMADALDQYAVFVLAYPSDSFLLEDVVPPANKTGE
jgi:hypothetical protein